MKPLAQQTILITGSTDGLGKQTALALARQGATVLLHGRNQQRLETTLRDIQDVTGERHLETYLPASGLQWSPVLSATANRCSL